MNMFAAIAVAAVAIAAIIVTPIASIWALNVLFGLGIAYTVKTWLAALILAAIVSPSVTVKKS
jgi:hypothetical protein